MTYETVIGLEVHSQLATKSKIFCSCSTSFGAEANSQTCPGCQGLPGTLPFLNEEAVNLAIKLALAVKGKINSISTFERKHYFYPDLPLGYQITQNSHPIISGGEVEINTAGIEKTIRLHHIHLEADAGKLIHDEHQQESLIDLNRAGCGLLEIVSEPDLRSADEVIAYLKNLREILIYLNISNANMEEGNLRCDVNISLRPMGDLKLGVRTELKNINSFRSITRAISYEIRRQKAALDNNEALIQETRLFNEVDGTTQSMREKEDSQDYRYFPDPNLPPIIVSNKQIQDILEKLPELASVKRQRYQKDYDLAAKDIETICQDPKLANYFEECLNFFSSKSKVKYAKIITNWLLSEFLRELNLAKLEPDKSLLSPKNMAELLLLVEDNKLSGPLAKEIFPQMFKSGEKAAKIMSEKNIEVLSSEDSLNPIIKKVLTENTAQVKQFLEGRKKVLGFLVGQVMKLSKKQADPKLAGELLTTQLEKIKAEQ